MTSTGSTSFTGFKSINLKLCVFFSNFICFCENCYSSSFKIFHEPVLSEPILSITLRSFRSLIFLLTVGKLLPSFTEISFVVILLFSLINENVVSFLLFTASLAICKYLFFKILLPLNNKFCKNPIGNSLVAYTLFE